MRYFDLRRAGHRSLPRLNRQGSDTVRGPLGRDECEDCGLPIFPQLDAPLTYQTRRSIYSHYRRGESVESLARRFDCTKASVGRLIGMMRARRIEGLSLDFIDSGEFPEFCGGAREHEILGPTPRGEPVRDKPRVPRDLPPYLTGLYKTPLLSRAEEVHLFRKMNYLK